MSCFASCLGCKNGVERGSGGDYCEVLDLHVGGLHLPYINLPSLVFYESPFSLRIVLSINLPPRIGANCCQNA